tara:strand:+ start:212 stop:412 length:201 start_codon:yes stop_codon:yes gene_type:complete
MIIKSKQILIDKIEKLDEQSMQDTLYEGGTAHEISDVGHSIKCWSLKYVPNKVLKRWIKRFEKEKK